MYYVDLHERIFNNKVEIGVMYYGIALPFVPCPGTTLYLTHLSGTEFDVNRVEIMLPDEDEPEDDFTYILHGSKYVEDIENYVKYNRAEWNVEVFKGEFNV